MFSTATVPFYNPTSSAIGLQFLHILDNTCYYLSFLFHPSVCESGMSLWFFMSLMTNDTEHLFMCILAICISPV